jgi:hypothetical protein
MLGQNTRGAFGKTAPSLGRSEAIATEEPPKMTTDNSPQLPWLLAQPAGWAL